MTHTPSAGQHLLLDMHGVTDLAARTTHELYRFLENLPPAIGMQAVSTPQFVFFDNYASDTPGLSAFIILAESHVSFHTWPERSYVSLDLYSCRTFDTKAAARHITDFWRPHGEVTMQVVDRG